MCPRPPAAAPVRIAFERALPADCRECVRGQLSKSKKADEKRQAQAESREAYNLALKELNQVEKTVHADLRGYLVQLHDMETKRVDHTQQAMVIVALLSI